MSDRGDPAGRKLTGDRDGDLHDTGGDRGGRRNGTASGFAGGGAEFRGERRSGDAGYGSRDGRQLPEPAEGGGRGFSDRISGRDPGRGAERAERDRVHDHGEQYGYGGRTGIPGHSICVLFAGGNAYAVAQTVFDKKAPGIGTYGNLEMPVTDAWGNEHTIRLQRITNANVVLTIEIQPLEGYDSTVPDRIREALVAYGSTLSVGQDLVVSSLYPVDIRGGGDGESGFFGEVVDSDIWRDDDKWDSDGELESEVWDQSGAGTDCGSELRDGLKAGGETVGRAFFLQLTLKQKDPSPRFTQAETTWFLSLQKEIEIDKGE